MHPFLEMRVADYMTPAVVSVSPTTSLSELEQLFARHDYNGFPVVEAGVLAGMVTKFDVLRVFAFTGQTIVPPYAELARLTAGQIMSRDVVTFAPDAPMTRVLQTIVDFRMRSFPVVDGGRLFGMIAREDAVRALRNAFAKEPVTPA